MAGPVTQRRPTFLWQAALILLPVAVLTVMGWFSLRQDKILAEHDAKERAQAIADDLLPKIWNELTNKPAASLHEDKQLLFQFDQSGRLIFPPDYPRVPAATPFDIAELDSNQARLWAIIQNSSVGTNNMDVLIRACMELVASHPPENFAAAAQYDLGVLLLRQKKLLEAAEVFDLIVKQYPDAVGESGIPLQPLSQMKLFEVGMHRVTDFHQAIILSNGRSITAPGLAPSGRENFISVETLCSNLVLQPTLLTPLLLTQIQERLNPIQKILGAAIGFSMKENPFEMQESIGRWGRIWEYHEMLRSLFLAAKPGFHADAYPRMPRFFLLDTPKQSDFTRMSGSRIHPGRPGNPWITIWNPYEGHTWLAVRFDESETNATFTCRSASRFGDWVNGLVKTNKGIPDYFGIGVEVAGKKITVNAPDLHIWHLVNWANPHSEGGGVKKEFSGNLASTILASAAKSEDGEETLKVNVYLTGPDALYQRQQARAFWFGSLIAVSTVAALIGLLTAWRAFRRQLQLSEMKSNFVSSVSHELRAPIASVRLMAENLEREKIHEPQKQKEYFAFIVQECRRLSSLIENVLDFSRIEQGRKQYEFEPTDMIALAKQTVNLMGPNAVEKGVRLVWETANSQQPAANSELNVDGRAIQQALVNLIDNAIKHSPKGETVTVEIQSGQDVLLGSGGGGLVCLLMLLSVSDCGPGIPLDEQEKIFERFYRRGSELRRETVGVGIGLSIVKHIIEAHGGRVRVRSEVGKGSRFTIELPMTKQNE